MSIRMRAAVLAAAAALSTAAVAQPAPDPGSVPTPTQERIAENPDNEFPWDLIGLVGLLGLLGLWRSSDNDGYTSDPI